MKIWERSREEGEEETPTPVTYNTRCSVGTLGRQVHYAQVLLVYCSFLSDGLPMYGKHVCRQ